MKTSTFVKIILIALVFTMVSIFIIATEIAEPGTIKESFFSKAPEPLDKFGPPEPFEGYWSSEEMSADYASGNYPE